MLVHGFPLTTHWVAVKRILRYLSGRYDSDWASDVDDTRYTSGSSILLAPIWSCAGLINSHLWPGQVKRENIVRWHIPL